MQLDLFEDTPTTDRPHCRMCARPARWVASRKQWSWYCNGTNCTNRERLCQACGSQFVVNVDGAGTKYCSAECKLNGYQPFRLQGEMSCAWCNKPTRRKKQGHIWPYICNDCIEPIRHLVNRLKLHHVPHERARQLLEQPGCEICGRDITAKIRDTQTGRMRSLLVVDHDHRCCPYTKSCGRCIRGLICFDCNAALGMLHDNVDSAVALAAYLARFTNDLDS